MIDRSGRVLIALALCLGGAGRAAAEPHTPAQLPAGDSALRRGHDEFERQARPFRAAFDALLARKPTLSPDDLKAEAIALVPRLAALEPAVSSPVSRLVYGTWQKDLGTMAGDNALVARGLQAMLDSGMLQSNLVPPVTAMLGQMAYLAHEYPTAIRVLLPLVGSAQVADAVPEMVADADAATGDPLAGLAALNTAITARQAAGATPPESWYARAAAIAHGANLPREAADWSVRQLVAFPSPLNWLRAVQTVRAAQDKLNAPDALDFARLGDRSGAFKAPSRYLAGEYGAWLQALDARKAPCEAQRVAGQGVAEGVLKADDPAVKDALDKAQASLAAAAAALPGMAAQAAADPTGKAALAAADAFLSCGDAARAEALYTMALTKGGIDADKPRALNRLGIAQFDQGRLAEAKASFAQVTGTREQAARLWTILADQRLAK